MHHSWCTVWGSGCNRDCHKCHAVHERHLVSSGGRRARQRTAKRNESIHKVKFRLFQESAGMLLDAKCKPLSIFYSDSSHASATSYQKILFLFRIWWACGERRDMMLSCNNILYICIYLYVCTHVHVLSYTYKYTHVGCHEWVHISKAPSLFLSRCLLLHLRICWPHGVELMTRIDRSLFTLVLLACVHHLESSCSV